MHRSHRHFQACMDFRGALYRLWYLREGRRTRPHCFMIPLHVMEKSRRRRRLLLRHPNASGLFIYSVLPSTMLLASNNLSRTSWLAEMPFRRHHDHQSAQESGEGDDAPIRRQLLQAAQVLPPVSAEAGISAAMQCANYVGKAFLYSTSPARLPQRCQSEGCCLHSFHILHYRGHCRLCEPQRQLLAILKPEPQERPWAVEYAPSYRASSTVGPLPTCSWRLSPA